MRMVAVAAVAVVSSFTTWAGTLYVDKEKGNDTTGNGSSENPYATIQKAVDESEAGGTVLVRPGVYDSGVTDGNERDSTIGASFRCRVYIDKKLTLESTDGAAVTHIVGAADTTSDTAYKGMGANAVRCIGIRKYSLSVFITGFTIRDGYSNNVGGSTTKTGSDNQVNYGGGICGHNAGALYSANATIPVSDCVITRCSATRGSAATGVMLVRTLVTDLPQYGAITRYVTMHNCIVSRIKDGTGVLNGTFLNYTKAVNCTIVENDIPPGINNGSLVNCVLFNNRNESTTDHSSASYSYCVMDYDKNTAAGTTMANGCKVVGDVYPKSIFAPAINDYAPVKDGPCDGVLSSDRATQIPSAYRDTDFLGKPRTTGSTMCPGAVEGTKVAVARILLPNGSFGKISVDGYPAFMRNSHINSAVYPEAHAVRVTSKTAGNEVYQIQTKRSSPFLEDWKGDIWITPHPLSLDTDQTITGLAEASVVYADPEADAAMADGTVDRPYRTLQQAIDAIGDGNAVIRAAAGRYGEGERLGDEGGVFKGSISNRVVLSRDGRKFIRAVDGPERTFLCGASDEAFENGCGPAAVRCIFQRKGVNFVAGFTVCGGRCAAYAGDGEDQRGAAVYKIAGDTTGSITLYGCMISNNVSSRASVSWGGEVVCCRVTGNESTDNGLLRNSATAVNCVFWGNGADSRADGSPNSTVVGDAAYAWNCTIAANDIRYAMAEGASSLHNCVVQNGYAGGSDIRSATVPKSTLYGVAAAGVSAETLAERGCLSEPRYLANAVAGDCRLLGNLSQGTSLATYENAYSKYLYPIDAFGIPYPGSADGTGLVPGGVAETTRGVRFGTTGTDGGISPAEAIGTDGAGSFTVTATKDRPFKGFEVDGVFTPQDTLTREISYTEESAPTNVVAVYDNNWYVDDNGSDANSGYTAGSAMRTFAAVFAKTVKGDVVHALPGRYDYETMIQSDQRTTRARVVVPDGRTLVADAGPSETLIVGADAETDPDENGLGIDAIRCAYVYSGGTLAGFRLDHGRTGNVNEESTGDNHGGGVLGGNDGALVRDCVFTDCRSVRGGGGRYGTYLRCKFLDCLATGTGAATRNGTCRTCFADRCKGQSVYYDSPCYGCTSGANNTDLTGGTGFYSFCQHADKYLTVNCLSVLGGIEPTYMSNCAYSASTSIGTGYRKEVVNSKVGEVEVDADGYPVVGHNVGVDQGDVSLASPSCLEADAAGGARILNNHMDIGAFEADWKPTYAKKLGGRGCTVTEAPWNAEAEVGPNRSVKLPAGTLACTLASARGDSDYTVRYSITGNGTLTVTLDGEQFDVRTGAGSFERKVPASVDPQALAFTYVPGENDAGGAVIESCRQVFGVLLLVR